MNNSKITFQENKDSLISALKETNQKQRELVALLIEDCSDLEHENTTLKKKLEECPRCS